MSWNKVLRFLFPVWFAIIDMDVNELDEIRINNYNLSKENNYEH